MPWVRWVDFYTCGVQIGSRRTDGLGTLPPKKTPPKKTPAVHAVWFDVAQNVRPLQFCGFVQFRRLAYYLAYGLAAHMQARACYPQSQ